MTMSSTRIAIGGIFVLALVAATFLFHRECDFGGGMPGWYRECTCKGIERLDYDQTAADGPRRTLLGDDGNPAAGVCHARGVNQDLPPVWMIYLPVGDLAESLRRVREEGGKVDDFKRLAFPPLGGLMR